MVSLRFAAPAALIVWACGCGGAAATAGGNSSTWGFVEPTDPRSVRSAREHRAELDVVVSGWIALDSVTGRPLTLYRDSVGQQRRPGTRYFAHVTSWLGQRFHVDPIRRLGANPVELAAAAGTIARLVAGGRYDGVVLDFESLEPGDRPALVAVVGAIADSVKATGQRTVVVAVPATDTVTFPSAELARRVDALLVMLYDQHWPGGDPGPIAAPDWARHWLAVRVRAVGADRVVAAFPFYGYHWQGDTGRHLGFEDARRLAAEAGVTLQRDPASGHLHATAPRFGTLWIPDARVLERMRQEAGDAGVRQFAFWYLGLEDPNFWETPGR